MEPPSDSDPPPASWALTPEMAAHFAVCRSCAVYWFDAMLAICEEHGAVEGAEQLRAQRTWHLQKMAERDAN